jgi:hypothetical protein
VIAGTEDKNPVVELSRKFHEYQDAASQRKKERLPEQKKGFTVQHLTENVTIDLCELLPDPPLMSEHVNAMFDDSGRENVRETTFRSLMNQVRGLCLIK